MKPEEMDLETTRDVRENMDSPTNPTKVIRLKCLDCCCGSYTEVERCNVKLCPLHPWRMGKNPYRKKIVLTDERKASMVAALERGRSKKTIG